MEHNFVDDAGHLINAVTGMKTSISNDKDKVHVMETVGRCRTSFRLRDPWSRHQEAHGLSDPARRSTARYAALSWRCRQAEKRPLVTTWEEDVT